jgi:HK97 family phage prohead protease
VSDDTHLRTYEFRAQVDGDGNTLEGYASVFDQPYDVSDHLGVYRETVAKGAFRKTLRERTPVCQLDHGQHPLLGSLPLGPFTRLAEDSHGLHFRVAMHSSWIFEPVREAVRSGAISGCSIRFSVPKGKEDWNDKRSERTIREARLFELGPVVFPAAATTSVALRSLLSSIDDDERATLLDEFGTRTGAVDVVDTPAPESPPVEDEPIALITRQARRRRGLILRGVINEQALGGLAREAG